MLSLRWQSHQNYSDKTLKRASQSVMTKAQLCKNRPSFYVFIHKGSLIGSYQGFTTFISRSRGQKWIQDLPKPYKYRFKKRVEKRERWERKKWRRRKIFIRNLSVKIQKLNIKDFSSFEMIISWREAKLSKEKQNKE